MQTCDVNIVMQSYKLNIQGDAKLRIGYRVVQSYVSNVQGDAKLRAEYRG
jgi:hypothetical protein